MPCVLAALLARAASTGRIQVDGLVMLSEATFPSWSQQAMCAASHPAPECITDGYPVVSLTSFSRLVQKAECAESILSLHLREVHVLDRQDDYPWDADEAHSAH